MIIDETYSVQIAGMINKALAGTQFEVTGIFTTLDGVHIWVFDARYDQKYRIAVEAVTERKS